MVTIPEWAVKRWHRMGMVLVLPKEWTPAQAEALKTQLEEWGVSTSGVRTFNDQWGGPVWYIP